jgi:hypothetical protein
METKDDSGNGGGQWGNQPDASIITTLKMDEMLLIWVGMMRMMCPVVATQGNVTQPEKAVENKDRGNRLWE